MTWSWEYLPSEEHVIGAAASAFVAEVEQKADELVRAAEALHLAGVVRRGVPLGTAGAELCRTASPSAP